MLDQRTAFQTLVPSLPIMQLSHQVTSLEAIYHVDCSFLFTRAAVSLMITSEMHVSISYIEPGLLKTTEKQSVFLFNERKQV